VYTVFAPYSPSHTLSPPPPDLSVLCPHHILCIPRDIIWPNQTPLLWLEFVLYPRGSQVIVKTSNSIIVLPVVVTHN
jgi:hypothetical protein